MQRLKPKPTTAPSSSLTLDDLADQPRWVAWQVETRDGRPTKVPYNPHNGKKGRTDDCDTWGTKDEAQRRWRKMQHGGADGGGIGIVLGDLGDGTHLAGIDLDRCRDEKTDTLSSWANEVIERFGTYTETSPSAKGVKLLFLIDTEDHQLVDKLMGGKKRRAFAADEHCEIALDYDHRYYAVTEQSRSGKCLRIVPLDDLRWLLEEAGPRFMKMHGPRDAPATATRVSTGDQSGSGFGYRFLADCKWRGESFEEACQAILADQGKAGEWARRMDRRALELAWAKAADALYNWEQPNWGLLDDRRGKLPGFPLDALEPAALRDWAQSAADGTATSIGHVAAPVLGVASAMIGGARRVKPSPRWSEPMTLWVGIIGFSGDGKTPGMDPARRAVDQIEDDHAHVNDTRRREHQHDADYARAVRGDQEAKLKEAAKTRKKPPMPTDADEPKPFVEQKLLLMDTTVERAAQLLQGRPFGMLLFDDELYGWFANMARNSKGQDNQFWLKAWDGKAFSQERVSRASVRIPHLLIGVVGGLQPDRVADSFKGAADGMYARFLFLWPKRARFKLLSDEPADDAVLAKALARLSKIGDEIGGGPRSLDLSESAYQAFEELRREVYWEADALDGKEREWWLKMPAQVLRLAGTLAYLDWAFGTQIKEPDMITSRFINNAVLLARDYFWPHARAVLRQIGLTDRHAKARRVLKWLQSYQPEQVAVEDIRTKALSGLDADECLSLINELTRAGWLRKHSGQSGPKGGKPRHRWEVNAQLYGRDK